MDRFQAMRVFLAVAEGGGFAEAARRLALSPPAVTRAVSALEAHIGSRLLTRTTRLVKLTEAGARYLDDCRRILADVDEAEAAAAGSYAIPSGVLTVTASVMFGRIYVQPVVLDFLRAHPAVTGRTLFLDRITNLIDEGIDVAVRIAHLPDSSFRAQRVGSVRRIVCAAPSYLAEHGVPQTPDELTGHSVIAFTHNHTGAGAEWRFGREDKIRVAVSPRLYCNTNDAVIAAAEAGWGLARVLSYQVGPALAAGRLQAVLTEYEEEPVPVQVVHVEGRRASAKVRAFVDFAVERLRANPLVNPEAGR